MKKLWVYKRKGIKGWWTGWYEGSSRRKAKAFPTKALAEHFRHIKYTQLNSDVFTSVVDFDWQQMVEEYRQFKQVEGRKEASIYEALLTLRHFERIVSANSSHEVTQQNLDAFVLKRGEEAGKSTLNKDIPARPSAATKEVRRLALCPASFRKRSAVSFEAPSSPPGRPRGGR
jgi:hypothetical protein